jgi:hypothetical protein
MSSRDKTLLAVIVLIVIAVGGYFLVVQPEHSKANKLQDQITTANSNLQQAEATVRSGEQAEAQYKIYAQQFKSISAAVPSDEQIPALINELQAASTKTKVGFQAVSVAATTAAATVAPATPTTATTSAAAITFPSQSFSLSFTGSYFAVANLLGKLSSFVHADDKHFHATGRLLSISSVSMTPGSSTAASTDSASSTANGAVTASVTALDYDVPSSTSASSPSTTSSTS